MLADNRQGAEIYHLHLATPIIFIWLAKCSILTFA